MNARTLVDAGTRSATPVASGFGDFFRYHGWLAPGVRLFRRLSFKAKAAWVSAAFVAPLLMTLTFLQADAREQISVARSERDGVAYVQPLLELLAAAQERRRVAVLGSGGLDEAQQKVDAGLRAVEAAQARYGESMHTGEAYAAFKKAHEALRGAPTRANSDETFAAHAEYVDAILDLVRSVADGSQLSLDPELNTYHMMVYAVQRGPGQLENTDRLRTLGMLSVKEQLRGREVTARRHDWMTQALALWQFIEDEAESSFQISMKAEPEAARGFDMKAADAASEALRKATAHLLGASAETPGADAVERFAQVGNDALQRQQKLAQQVLGLLDTRLQDRADRVQNRLITQVALAGAFVLLAGYLFMAFYRVMLGGLQEVSGHLREMTQGNLTTAPRPWGSDEAAELMLTLGAMQASLRRVATTVLDGSAHVLQASHEISSASQDLSQRTESTASSLEETASSMAQIGTVVARTGETVSGAGAIVRTNADAASRGSDVMAQVERTMQGIQTASNRIGEIIGVIDGIAFQTNILALNAAVEAARAGEQGRGFAVVASEVRALAGRSAAAAREVKTLIGASLTEVETGTQVVAEAGGTMRDILANANRIASMIGEIDQATREQGAGIGHVGSAIHDIDRATQQNAALVEQTAAAAATLSAQSRRLAEEIAFFKLK
ncbi:MAG: hypothetical protein JNN18_17170 [Rubrivivax sp.]|jgi:methyl-accepting chemotaxis protein|nr:hypothetical protein [Rubrivivax sp.]